MFIAGLILGGWIGAFIGIGLMCLLPNASVKPLNLFMGI